MPGFNQKGPMGQGPMTGRKIGRCTNYGAPCPHMDHFEKFITEKYGIKVIFGTHPIPQKYYLTHEKLNTWNTPFFRESIKPTLSDENTRLSYD